MSPVSTPRRPKCLPPKSSKRTLKPNTYKIVEQAVEEGVRFGWNHAHKHVACPGGEAIRENIISDVMLAMSDPYVHVEHDEDDDRRIYVDEFPCFAPGVLNPLRREMIEFDASLDD